jgi:integrase
VRRDKGAADSWTTIITTGCQCQAEAWSGGGAPADGGNLYLQCTFGADGNVRRSWLFRYERDGRRREMGLGPLHTIGLGEARDKARSLRQQILDDIDPLTAKRQRRAEQRLEAAKAMTFGACVEAYLATHEIAWKNDKHRQQWRMTLTRYCKSISDLPVKDIDTDLVLRVLTPLWATRTETATRLRGRIERVLAWAKGRGLRDGENPARWSGHLDEMLARPSKVHSVKHHSALPYQELPAFMAELRARDSLSARALELTILCGTRTSETIGATWSEIDLKAKIWTVPAERMKAGKEHRIPLSDRAVETLASLPRHGGRVFPLSNMAMLECLRGMRPGATTHGFRSSLRTWSSEATSFPHEVCEQALAHTISNKVERAYRRGDLFQKRAAMMQAWAGFCAKPPTAGQVVTLRGIGHRGGAHHRLG